jgi:hypothetical protein
MPYTIMDLFDNNKEKTKKEDGYIHEQLSLDFDIDTNVVPVVTAMDISEDFIYVITFKRKGDLWECIKMDLKGNEKGRIFLLLNRYEHLSFYPLLYSVYKKNMRSFYRCIRVKI